MERFGYAVKMRLENNAQIHDDSKDRKEEGEEKNEVSKESEKMRECENGQADPLIDVRVCCSWQFAERVGQGTRLHHVSLRPKVTPVIITRYPRQADL
jgi:hypothetical protein